MTAADNLPVLVGAGQVVQRPVQGVPATGCLGPLELMAAAAKEAGENAASPGLLRQLEWIGVAGGYWSYRDPGARLAASLGATSAATALSSISGTAPLEMLAIAAERIQQGEISVALVAGGEARWSRMWFKRNGLEPPWDTRRGEGTPEQLSGFSGQMLAEATQIGSPAVAYALMEDGLRTAHRRTVAEQTEIIARLWSSFSAVAAENAYAWDRVAHPPDDISQPTPMNRMIACPYTKAMVANNTVDMASALIMTSRRVARMAGVPEDLWVYPRAAVACHEEWRMADRRSLHSLPALRRAGDVVCRRAAIEPAEIEHVDLYACFPSIVQMSSDALGLSIERRLTLTGGLGFAGAPIGNAAGQSVAAMVCAVRRDQGWGLLHANGGNATKHVLALFAPEGGERFVLDRIDGVPEDRVAGLGSGSTGMGEVEAATVVFDRDGPSHVAAAVLMAGSRGFSRNSSANVIDSALEGRLVGTGVRLRHDGTFRA